MAPRHPFFAGLKPTLHISHRGGALLAPENTLVAFTQAALKYQTQMLELDVQLTRDGVLVVAHDDTVDRCTDGVGDLHDLTWAEVERLDAGFQFTPDGGRTWPYRGLDVRIPRLREVLATFPTLRFNIEVKRGHPGIEDLFREEIEGADATHRICCGAVEDALGARLHQALPDAVHFYPRDALTAFVLAARSGEEPPNDPRYLVLDMPLEYAGMRLINADLLRAADEHGKWINVWTIDDRAEMDRLIAEGVGGIMTDRPDLLREALDARA